MTVPYDVVLTKGNVVAGEWECLWLPRTIRGASKYGVVLCHGAESDPAGAFDWAKPTQPGQAKLAHALAAEGIPCIAARFAGNRWANDAMSGAGAGSYISLAGLYLAAQSGCSSSKIALGGSSMGGANSLRWASLNQASAAALFGFIPGVSLEHFYNDNPASTVAGNTSLAWSISQAWGLTSPRIVSDGSITNGDATLTSATAAFTGADVGRQIIRGFTQTGIPVDTTILSVTNGTTVEMDKNAGATAGSQVLAFADPLPMTGTAGADLIGVHGPRIAAAGIPHRMWYSPTDPLVYSADVLAMATATGGTAYDAGNAGHTGATIVAAESIPSGSDWSDTIAWLMAAGC